MLEKIKSGILGLAVGDAVGVPVEFTSRQKLSICPIETMQGYGTYNLPAGSWSDDTSMTLGLLDTLKPGFKYSQVMDAFKEWLMAGKYTPWGDMFDIGNATFDAIKHYIMGIPALECGLKDSMSNGNGSLMRVLPAAFYIKSKGHALPFEADGYVGLIHNISALTHAHTRSKVGCGIYIACAMAIMDDPTIAGLNAGLKAAKNYYENNPKYSHEFTFYKRIFTPGFASTQENDIQSSGYVVHTLEAALWCLMNTKSYKECILKAVNLGEDTDTVAAVAGGLAGLMYGLDGIPDEWLNTLAKRDYIEELCCKFYDRL